jgi:hypothetical protein
MQSDKSAPPVGRPLQQPKSRPNLGQTAVLWAPLSLIVTVFAAIACAYSVRVPLYEAPDEPAHVSYVESIAFDHKLPAARSTYEAQHPPLYYAIEAVVTRALGLPYAPSRATNPAWENATVTLEDVAHYQHPNEAFPWPRNVWTIQVMRAVTILFGVTLVILTYFTAKLLFPGRRLLALSATATAGWVPQFAFISGTVNNDVPAAAFGALAIYAGLRYFKNSEPLYLILSTVAVGLAALTKSTAAITGVVPLAAIILTGTSWRDRVRGVTIVCLIPALIAGWFYVRSLVMWGNLFASNDFGVVLHPHGLTDPLYRTIFFDTLFDSYWFTGGWANIHFLPLTYRLLAIFPALAAGGVIVGLRRSPLDRGQRFGLCVFAVLLVIAVLGVIEYSVVQDYGPQGRYLFAVQSAIAILLTYGIGTVFSRDGETDHAAMLILPAVLLAMNAWVFLVKLPAVYG